MATLAIVMSLTACDRAQPPPGSPNVILILIDTLRADHLGLYGYERNTAPALAALARRGVCFDRFYSHSAATRPSVASLFTSQYPSGHGVVHQRTEALPDDLPTLASVFKDAGYFTLAFVTNPQVHGRLGFARGFDRYVMLFGRDVRPLQIRPRDLTTPPPAARVMELVEEALSSPMERPFFAYVHLLDPHGPYSPPEKLRQRFSDPDYAGAVTGSIEDFARIKNAGKSSGPDLQHFISLYDAEIAATDQAIGDFVAWMDQQNLTSRTHLIVTADHGEEFMEHGSTGHAYDLFGETVGVPLIWTGPGIPEDRRVSLLAGIVDIFPTLANLLRLPVDPQQLSGADLSPAWEQPDDSARSWREAVFLEGPDRDIVTADGRRVPQAVRGAITEAGKSIALGCSWQDPSWRKMLVFDLDVDPREQRGETIEADSGPVPTQDQAQVHLLEDFCQRAAQQARSRAQRRVVLSREILEKLRSLGYSDSD